MDAYRIIDVGILIKMFKENKIYFASPLNWQDKWEKLDIEYPTKRQTTLFNRKRGRIYAQCWTKENYSWALWKMLSPNGYGVSLKTDLSKLYSLMPSDIRNDYKIDDIIKKVIYLKEEEIIDNIKKSSLKENIALNSILKMFYLKRRAFTFEEEYRIIIPKKRNYSSLQFEKIGDKRFVSYKCNPCDYILSIYFDSNIDPYVYDVFKSIFIEFGFKGTIGKSTIDERPNKIILNAS